MSAVRARFPWRRVMMRGLHDLRLAPSEFWRSTLRELVPVAGSPSPQGLRQSLTDLMARWPDEDHA
ncbi:phage tail assembly chaperone [Aestuariivirga sp.]|uniref:phage tail assembly chaperone n=1 Tax=Aestuariivirga sp. TaxID=2650926 RepID=UPI0039E51099